MIVWNDTLLVTNMVLFFRQQIEFSAEFLIADKCCVLTLPFCKTMQMHKITK